jgi:tetratricopeptide (TPR) repeat protein
MTGFGETPEKTGNMERSNKMDESVRRGIGFYKNNDYQRAIQAFSEAITRNPNNAQVYVYRGLAYAYARQRTNAIADYNRALELDPDNIGATRRLLPAIEACEGPQQQTLSDLRESVGRILRAREVNLEDIKDSETTFLIGIRKVVNYPLGGSFNCGFSKRDNGDYGLYVGLCPDRNAGGRTIDTDTMNKIIDIRNAMRKVPIGQRPDFVTNSSAQENVARVTPEKQWHQLEDWLLGFKLEQFLAGQITIPAAEERMRIALGYFLDWEKAVFSQL